MRTADILVFMGLDFVPGAFARRAPKLRWIQMTCAGVEHIAPFDWLPEHVIVTNNSGVHAERHGEFALSAILMLNNSIPFIAANQRTSRWQARFSSPVAGKTLAVIGVGHIGGRAAQHAKQLGMIVLGVRRTGQAHAHIDEMFRLDELDQVLPRADFVLVTLPLTPATRNVIGRSELALMREGAGLANLGRGATVDYIALADILASGRLSGAVLDAFEEEPLPATSPLWATPNVLISPHCSSSDPERYIPMTLDLTFQNIERILQGEVLLNGIDRALGY
jgi:phosphoglycerate dehydrogenase-like enzyme